MLDRTCHRLATPIKFVAVGLFNTGWSYLLYAGLLFVGLGYWAASLVTIVLSVGVGFLTQGNLVFGGATRDALPRFLVVWTLIYITYLVVVGTAQRFGMNHYLGGLLATPVVVTLSYVLQRRYVFRAT